MGENGTFFGHTTPLTTWYVEDNSEREAFAERLVYVTIDLVVEETMEPDAWGPFSMLHVVFRTTERGARMLRILHV